MQSLFFLRNFEMKKIIIGVLAALTLQGCGTQLFQNVCPAGTKVATVGYSPMYVGQQLSNYAVKECVPITLAQK